MSQRYTCEWKPAADFGTTRIINVNDAKANHYTTQNVQVWWDSHSTTARCTQCSGPLVAMSASCPHAQAAKRFASLARAEGVAPPKPGKAKR